MAARVLAALRAAAERSAFVRRLAALRAWRDRALRDTVLRGMRRKAFSVARARVREVSPVRRRARVRAPALRLGELRVAALRRDEAERFAVLRREVAVRLVGLRREVAVRLAPLRRDVAARFVGLRREVVLRLVLLLRRVEPLRLDFPPALRGLRDDFARVLRFGFSGMPTPARRASESPMAMACLAFFAPCSPLRIWSISRCTNSPACVLADLPSRLSSRARWMVSLSGMGHPKSVDGAFAVQSMCP